MYLKVLKGSLALWVSQIDSPETGTQARSSTTHSHYYAKLGLFPSYPSTLVLLRSDPLPPSALAPPLLSQRRRTHFLQPSTIEDPFRWHCLLGARDFKCRLFGTRFSSIMYDSPLFGEVAMGEFYAHSVEHV